MKKTKLKRHAAAGKNTCQITKKKDTPEKMKVILIVTIVMKE